MQRHFEELTTAGQTCKRVSLRKPFVPILFLLLMTMFALVQCKQPEHVEQALLHGKWDIHKAERNGKETPYLRGGYMVINADGTITINITGEDERGKYVLDKEVLRMNDDKEFNIRSLTADSLTVAFRASSQSDFVFYMNRHRDEAQ